MVFQIPTPISLIASHAPSQSPEKTLLIKSMTPLKTSIKPERAPEIPSTKLPMADRMRSPFASQKFPRNSLAAENAFPRMVMIFPIISIRPPMIFFILSPFCDQMLPRKSLTAENPFPSKSISFPSNSLAPLIKAPIFSLATSESMPIFSKKTPIILASPFIKAIRSSMANAIRAITATRAIVFKWIGFSTEVIPFSIPGIFPRNPMIFPAFKPSQIDPAAMAISLSRFSNPPSLSANLSTKATALSSQFISFPKIVTSNLESLSVILYWSLILATHTPHWLRMLSSASDTVIFTLPNARLISSALLTMAFFRSATVICPALAISSNCSLLAPTSFSRSFTASGASSNRRLIVSVSTTPRAKDWLRASCISATCSLDLPADRKSLLVSSAYCAASSTLPNKSLFDCTRLPTNLAVSP